MELLIPFANTGEKEDFSTTTDPTGKVSLEKGFTELYELKPEEGGLFILRKVFNQMMNLVTTDTVNWKTQTFPNWIADKGDGLPYAYPKNALVKYTDGNTYVSKIDNNTAVPTDIDSWVNFEDFGSLNINALPEKTTPADTDNFALQETGGLLKKLSWTNLKATLLTYFDGFFTRKPELITITGTATFSPTGQTIDMTGIGNLTLAIGDVIQVTSPLNTRLHTVESIPNVNQIVVNYENRGTSTPAPKGRLVTETATATITLYNRAKNAPLGQGQYWCNPASGRSFGTTYTNNTKREYEIYLQSNVASAGTSSTTIEQDFESSYVCVNSNSQGGSIAGGRAIVYPGDYKVVGGVSNNLQKFYERR